MAGTIGATYIACARARGLMPMDEDETYIACMRARGRVCARERRDRYELDPVFAAPQCPPARRARSIPCIARAPPRVTVARSAGGYDPVTLV
jgi:hypothetical protein